MVSSFFPPSSEVIDHASVCVTDENRQLIASHMNAVSSAVDLLQYHASNEFVLENAAALTHQCLHVVCRHLVCGQ